MTRFWHPVADMHAVSASGELILDRGDGVYLWDEDGRRYLDSTASLWYMNVGFGRDEIADAAYAQLKKLPAYSAYADLATRPAVDLAERISAIAPMDDAVVFFTSGGAEAIETAAKLARRYWSLRGHTNKTVVISRERAYHGMAAYGTSIAGADAFQVGLGTLVSDTVRIPWSSTEALQAAIDEAGPDRVAAFFCEPIIGAGGVLVPPEGYLAEARRICREAGVLFVADEVICGYGRVGAWFASTRFDLDPDLLVFAKGITSGYVPLGWCHRLATRLGAVLEDERRRRVASRLHVLGPRRRHRGRARESRHHRARGPGRTGSLARGRARRRAPPAREPPARQRDSLGTGPRRGNPDRPASSLPTTPGFRIASPSPHASTGSWHAPSSAAPCRSRRPSSSPGPRWTR